MLSRPRKPPSNRLRPSRSLRFSHQVKFGTSVLKVRLRNGDRLVAQAVPVEAVVEERRPGVNGRIHVVEVPLVGGKLAVRVLIAIEQHQRELFVGEVRVDERQRHRVEGQVPGGEPRVFPLVRHRDDVGAVHVEPVLVAGRGAPVSRLTPRSFSHRSTS